MNLQAVLIEMAVEIDNEIMAKESTLNNRFDAPIYGALINVKRKASIFRESITSLTNDFTLQQEIIQNYKNDKKKILEDLSKIES